MWGETVTMASRMESSGVSGQVQVSEAALLRLGGRLAVEARENVLIKGGADVSGHLVTKHDHRGEAQVLLLD